MEHTIDCPKCGSPRVRMHNPESLCETAYPDTPHVFDAVATTQAICDDCGYQCGVEGHITWQQPKALPKQKTVAYTVTFLLDADTDVEDFKISIESALGCSDNITCKGYKTKIDLVV